MNNKKYSENAMNLTDKDIKNYLKLTDDLNVNVMFEIVKNIYKTNFLSSSEKEKIVSFFKNKNLTPKEFIILQSLKNKKVKIMALVETYFSMLDFELHFENGNLKSKSLISKKEWILDSRKTKIKGLPNLPSSESFIITAFDTEEQVIKVRDFMKNYNQKKYFTEGVKGTLTSEVHINGKIFIEDFFTEELFDGSFLDKAYSSGISEEKLFGKCLEILLNK